jgi:hypothetical protein
MNGKLLAERTRAMIPGYEQMFGERGGITPSDPLEFHLYHLARYWSRLVGFCRQVPEKPETAVDTDLGVCVAVGSEFAHKLIDPSLPFYELWQDYWRRTQSVLHERPVTLEQVEAASRTFNECLSVLKYDPWS